MAAQPTAHTDYRPAIEQLEKLIAQLSKTYGIRGIAIALVDDQQTVYARGFGTAKKDSIFRAGSISKVFNAVAVMQLVEQGKLDLDAPIGGYGRQFSTVVPYDDAPPITLRNILCHRSGMVREAPVGGYLDDTEPSLAETVEAVRSCVLLDPPNVKTRYSNCAPSLAGRIIETVAGVSFEQYQQAHLLGPIGMTSSAFLLENLPRDRVLLGYMRITDGQGGFTVAPAPLFDLGTIPAGNLYTTVEDLAKFMHMLAADGRAGGKPIIAPKTLAEMFTPQLVDVEVAFGVGFMVGKFQGHKSVGHSGAVYGHSAAMTFLPELKIGVAVLSNEDIVTGPIGKLAAKALALMVAAKLGKPSEPSPTPIELAPAELAVFVGQYESSSYWAKIDIVDGRLVGAISGQSVSLTPIAPLKFLADGRMSNAVEILFERGDAGQIVGFTAQLDRVPLEKRPEGSADGKVSGFTALGQKFVRVDPKAVPDAAPAWADYAGSYGLTFVPLVVRVHHGHLYALIENEYEYRLIPESQNVFRFPPGMYWQEKLVFHIDPQGKVLGATLANMYLKRW
jgi:serine beta-lactamase-like protein LACTB